MYFTAIKKTNKIDYTCYVQKYETLEAIKSNIAFNFF